MNLASVSFNLSVIKRFEFINLGFMLLLLHLSLYQTDLNTPLQLSLLLAHIGFFLLWQPALNASDEIHLKTLLSILFINTLLYLLLGSWFIAIWIILLIGLTGGSAMINGLHRSVYALAAVILFLQLSLILTPRLFHMNVLDSELQQIIYYSLFAACLLSMLWTTKNRRAVKIDYLHSLIISFGLFSFYITSILVSFTSGIHYLQALLMTALSMGTFFLLISLIWFPRHGLASVAQIWEQHILNIGNPFEHWVKQTALLSQNNKMTPDLFLNNSIEQLLQLSWVCGLDWGDSQHEQRYGERSHYVTSFQEGDITIILYSHIPMGSALKIHAQLLLHLMCYFYNSKLREITLKNQTHLKAVYETGAKLTHDIKNLLQSLQTLTSIVETADDADEIQAIIKRQLPLFTQRLQNTLDKLQTRSDTGKAFSELSTWWSELASRYHGRDIEFIGTTSDTLKIDTEVFNTVLENLLENARNKRRNNPDIRITTTLHIEHEHVRITVCDSGEPVNSENASHLFKQILPSKDGYGIGLYQSAQLAARNGYRLELIQNTTGNVCFQISRNDQNT